MIEVIYYLLDKILGNTIKAGSQSIATRTQIAIKRKRANVISGIEELRAAILGGEVESGDLIRLRCRPSPVGPIIESPFVHPMYERAASLMTPEGPGETFWTGTFAHIPVPAAFMPTVDSEHVQLFLFPPGTSSIGDISPAGGPRVEDYILALCPTQSLQHAYCDTDVTGVLTKVGPHEFEAAGVDIWRYMSREGDQGVWILNAAVPEAEFEQIDEKAARFQGSLYVSGHWELDAERFPIGGAIDVASGAVQEAGLEMWNTFMPRLGGNTVVGAADSSLRINISGAAPFYSAHMSTNFATDNSEDRQLFENAVLGLNKNMMSLCDSLSVGLRNPMDVDIWHTPRSEHLRVLSSGAAESISDPLILAMREWHRLRNENS